MSYSQVTALKRPGALLALVLTTVLAALSAVVGAILVYAGGKDLASGNMDEYLVNHPQELRGVSVSNVKAISGKLWDSLIDDRYSTMSARAGMAIFFAVWLLIMGLLVLKGAVWVRVLITVGAVLALIPHFLIVGDYEPTSIAALSIVAMVLGFVALVLCWLPPVNRFAKARKAVSSPLRQPA